MIYTYRVTIDGKKVVHVDSSKAKSAVNFAMVDSGIQSAEYVMASRVENGILIADRFYCSCFIADDESLVFEESHSF